MKIYRILLIASIFFVPLFVLPFSADVINVPKTLLLYAACFFLLLLVGIRGVSKGELRLQRTLVDPLILLLILSALLSAVFSVSPIRSFFGFPHVFVLNVHAFVLLLVWFWLLLQEKPNASYERWLLFAVMGTGCLASIFFLVRDMAFLGSVRDIFLFQMFQPMSNANSIFAVLTAMIATLAIGVTSFRAFGTSSRVIAGFIALIQLIALLRLNFTPGWIVFCGGMIILLVIGMALLEATSVFALSFILVCVIGAVAISWFGLPDFFHANTPIEVALGTRPTWNITWQTLAHSFKNMTVGSGPGTFLFDFSLYRTSNFNLDPRTNDIRFPQGVNAIFTLLAEYGVIGIAIFAIFVLLVLGPLIESIRRGRSEREIILPTEFMALTAVTGAGWITLLFALFVTFLDFAGWFLFFTLMALTIRNLTPFLPRVLREHRFSLRGYAHYRLAVSFGIIFLCTVVAAYGVFLGRMYAGDIWYQKAEKLSWSSNPSVRVSFLEKAYEYRSFESMYAMALARTTLDEARVLASTSTPNGDDVAQKLASANDFAKQATAVEPADPTTWTLLAAIYLNTRSLTPEANDWAIDSLRKAIDLEPTNATLYTQLGNAYLFAKKMEDAEQAYRQAIALKSDAMDAYIGMSVLFENQEKITEAIAVFANIGPQLNDHPDSLYQVGRLFYNRNAKDDVDRAEKLWLRVVELQPDFGNVLYSLALLYDKKGNHVEAITYMEKVQALYPDNQDVVKVLKQWRGRQK